MGDSGRTAGGRGEVVDLDGAQKSSRGQNAQTNNEHTAAPAPPWAHLHAQPETPRTSVC